MRRHRWAWYVAAGLVGLPLLLRIFVLESFKIPAGSMIPTVQVGDHLFINKLKRDPKRGDVIVFKHPREPEKDFIKRVVAVGGDTIEVRDGQLYLNGRAVPRAARGGGASGCTYRDYEASEGAWRELPCVPFDEELDGQRYTVYYEPGSPPRSWPPTIVPPGHYYVMGDNRDHSADSRFWGTVPKDHVKGTLLGIWYRPSK